MNWRHFLGARWRALFQKGHLDERMEEKLRSHVEMQTRENIEAGMTPEEARRAAARQLGHVDSIKETARDQRGVAWLENLGRDLGEAARRLRKDPGFTAVAAITLALGIGANTVVFSIAKAVLFRSLGFEQASQLAWIHQENRSLSRVEENLSWTDYTDIQKASKSFASLAMFGSPGATWEHGDQIEEVTALIVTPELADILRIRPVLGRLIQPADVEAGAPPVVAISHEMWMTRFGGRPDILGQTLRLSDKPRTVVGVLPPGLEFPLQRAPSAGTGSVGHAGVQAVWLPLRVEGEDRQARGNRMFSVIGRLKPDSSVTVARVELETLSRRWEADHPTTNRGWTFTPVEFRDQVLGRTRPGIKVLAAAVAAVLLICCVNLANLLLARGVNRQRELAVRSALGAGRSRMIRTLLTESLLLSLLGCVPGMLLAAATVHGIQLVGATEVPFLREATVDWSVLAFTGGLAVFTTLLFGLFPAIWMSRIDPAKALRSGARSSSGPEITRWQKSLLAGQLAIVLTLLVSAGLLLESFRRLMSLHPGYESRPVIAVDISTWGFDTNGGVCRFYRALRERLAALPGVEAVGTTSSAPLTGKWTFDEKPQVVGQPVPEADRPLVAARFVAFDYFQAMGIPLVEGRLFRDSELKDDGYGQIVILNESAAARLFPGRSAIGGRFTVGSNADRVLEVIGVVKDTREVRLEEKPRPTFYWQYAFGGAQVLIRSSVPVRALIPLVQAALTQTDPRVTSTSDASPRPVNARILRHSIQPMTEIIAGTVAERRFAMVMIAAYALLALGIALVGVLGVVGYQVAQRTNEFGIRLALGALPAHLTCLVVAQAGRLVVFGLGFGLVVSLGVTRLLQSQLFGLSATDPLLLGGITLSLGGCALLACWCPARRAAKVDPLIALRAD